MQPRVTETTFDGRGLPWRETTGTGADTRTRFREFDPNGNLRRVVNPKGLEGGEPKHVDSGSDTEADLLNPTLHATVRTYDEDDLVTDVYMPWGERDARDRRRYKQSFIRDDRGRGLVESIVSAHELSAETAPRVSYEHFDSDWVAAATDEDVMDATTQEPAPSHLVDYDYNKRGDQVLWDSKNAGQTPRGRRITRTFYPNGTLATRTAEKEVPDEPGPDESKRSYSYFYNPNRSLAELSDSWDGRPAGQTERLTRFARDGAERETIVNETWASGKDTVTGYDDAGNIETRQTDGRRNADTGAYVDSNGGRDDAKTTAYAYDVLDRETQMSVAQGQTDVQRTIGRSYHPSGELAGKVKHTVGQAPDTDVLEQRFYTVHGELSEFSRKRRGAEGHIKQSAYAYDPNGNRTRDERGEHAYNAQDKLVRWVRSAKQKNPGKAVAYELDGTGAIRKQTDEALSAGKQETTYSYNGTRLTKTEDATSTSSFTYDDFGNVIKIKQTLKEAGTIFPPTGELPTLPETCGDLEDLATGTTVYCYDEFERMVAAKGPGLDDDPAVYEYDGLDRRDTKITKNLAGDQRRDYAYIGTTRMLSREQDADGKTLYYDYSSDGEREGQSVAPSSQTEPTEHRTYGKDANGSVEDLAEENGTVEASNQYRYDPYGELDRDVTDTATDPELQLGTAARDNPFRYEGFYYDSGVKTYDMQARQYRADIARFLTQDRFESATGDLNLQSDPLTQNRYAFAGGNPVNNIEFDGHAPVDKKRRAYANPNGRDQPDAFRPTFANPELAASEGTSFAQLSGQLTRGQYASARRAPVRKLFAQAARPHLTGRPINPFALQAQVSNVFKYEGLSDEVGAVPPGGRVKVPDPGESLLDRAFGRDYVYPEEATQVLLSGPGAGLSKLLRIGASKPGAPHTRLTPGGGLKAHEGLGRGHTLARHVGRSTNQLRDRLSQVARASTFNTRAIAEDAVSGALVAQRLRVRLFLSKSSPDDLLVVEQQFNRSIGQTLGRGETSASSVSNVRVVLQRDTSSLGYYVKTAYPIP